MDSRLFDPPLSLIGFHKDTWWCEDCKERQYNETVRYEYEARCSSCGKTLTLAERKRIATMREDMDWKFDIMGSMMGSLSGIFSGEENDE